MLKFSYIAFNQDTRYNMYVMKTGCKKLSCKLTPSVRPTTVRCSRIKQRLNVFYFSAALFSTVLGRIDLYSLTNLQWMERYSKQEKGVFLAVAKEKYSVSDQGQRKTGHGADE